MEQINGTSTIESENAPSAVIASQQDHGGSNLLAPCPTCGAVAASQTRSFVYALGRIEPRFPSPAVEKEFAQVGGRANASGLTDRQVFSALLSKRENRYLARDICWLLTVEGLETYILTPRDPGDIDLLVEAMRPAPSPMDIDLVIGVQGPVASPEMCNGLIIPTVAFDQIYSFDRDALIKSIPRPANIPVKQHATAAAEMLDRIMQLADNAGATDEHRAVNYLALRYPAIYALVADSYGKNLSFDAVEVRPSHLSNVRRIVDVIFSFKNRNTDVTEKHFVRVDVTEKFPYLVTKLTPYVDR